MLSVFHLHSESVPDGPGHLYILPEYSESGYISTLLLLPQPRCYLLMQYQLSVLHCLMYLLHLQYPYSAQMQDPDLPYLL